MDGADLNYYLTWLKDQLKLPVRNFLHSYHRGFDPLATTPMDRRLIIVSMPNYGIDIGRDHKIIGSANIDVS